MAVARLERRPPSAPAPAARDAAVFDLDRTLMPGSSLAIFGRLLADAGLLRRRDVARHSLREGIFAARGLGHHTLERLCRRLVNEATGHKQDDVVQVAREAAQLVERQVFPAARWLLERHADRGDRVLLLSAAPQELVGAVALALGAEVGLGTEAEVADGSYTGRLAGPFCHGSGKIERLLGVLSAAEIANCTAYADSASDLPVLRSARQAVAVHPDRTLAAVAARSGWPILRLR